jgi:small subunit ribosomal protein S15
MRGLVRFFTTGRPLGQAIPEKINPVLASKQFISPDASRSKARTLRRKEARLKQRIIRDVNNFKKYSLANVQFQVDPVLGDSSNGFISRIKQQLSNQSQFLASGYDRIEFEKLLYGAEKAALDKSKGSEMLNDSIRQVEQKKKAALLTILNLKNTNTKDRRNLAIKLARQEFARHEGDTASPEVQAAVATIKIHFGMDHVKQFPKDKAHIQSVRELVQQRQKILKYLKKDNPEKYYYTIAKLGLTDDVITREFAMSKQYFQDFKVWGDKQLVKLSEKQQRKAEKVADLQKRVHEYYEVAKKNYEILQRN